MSSSSSHRHISFAYLFMFKYALVFLWKLLRVWRQRSRYIYTYILVSFQVKLYVKKINELETFRLKNLFMLSLLQRIRMRCLLKHSSSSKETFPFVLCIYTVSSSSSQFAYSYKSTKMCIASYCCIFFAYWRSQNKSMELLK